MFKFKKTGWDLSEKILANNRAERLREELIYLQQEHPLPFDDDIVINIDDEFVSTPRVFMSIPKKAREGVTDKLLDWIKLHFEVTKAEREVRNAESNNPTFFWFIKLGGWIDAIKCPASQYWGMTFEPIIMIENANGGECKLVKKKKTITYFKAEGAGCK